MNEREKILYFLQRASDKQRGAFLYALICAMDTLENITQKNNEKEKIEQAQKNLEYNFPLALLEQTIFMLEQNRARRIENCLHLKMVLSRKEFLAKRAGYLPPLINSKERNKS